MFFRYVAVYPEKTRPDATRAIPGNCNILEKLKNYPTVKGLKLE